MRFLADENLRHDVVVSLRAAGHDVELVPPGATDATVAEIARNERRVLLTNDEDFAQTLAFPPPDYPGIVVFRLHPPSKERFLTALRPLLDMGSAALKGKTLIVREDAVIELS